MYGMYTVRPMERMGYEMPFDTTKLHVRPHARLHSSSEPGGLEQDGWRGAVSNDKGTDVAISHPKWDIVVNVMMCCVYMLHEEEV